MADQSVPSAIISKLFDPMTLLEAGIVAGGIMLGNMYFPGGLPGTPTPNPILSLALPALFVALEPAILGSIPALDDALAQSPVPLDVVFGAGGSALAYLIGANMAGQAMDSDLAYNMALHSLVVGGIAWGAKLVAGEAQRILYGADK